MPSAELLNSQIKFRIETNKNAYMVKETLVPIGLDSIAFFTFLPDFETNFFKLTASFVYNNTIENYKNCNKATERAIKYLSKSNSSIHVATSTQNPLVGDYMIFTVRVNQYVDNVYYHIVTASRIVFNDRLKMNSKQKTFDVALTR